jgi:hypothetical protein
MDPEPLTQTPQVVDHPAGGVTQEWVQTPPEPTCQAGLDRDGKRAVRASGGEAGIIARIRNATRRSK